MSMYTESLRQGAATTRRRGVQSAESLLKLIFESTEDPEERLSRWSSRVKKNQTFLDEVLEYTFKNWCQNIEYGRRQSERAAPVRRNPEEVRQAREIIKITAVKAVIANFVCPNGKTVMENTGTYLGKMLPGFGRIAKAAGAKIVGKVLSAEQVQKLWLGK